MAKRAACLLLLGAISCAGTERRPELSSLIDRLGSDDIVVREEATQELQRQGAAAESELREALRTADSEVSSRIDLLLRRIAVTKLISPELRQSLARPELRLEIEDRAWSTERSDRYHLVNSLYSHRIAHAVPLLRHFLSDPDAEIRKLSCLWLGVYRDQRSAERIAGLLEDSDPNVVMTALAVLGDFRDRRFANLPLLLLNAEASDVRKAAVVSLARLSPEEFRRRRNTLLADPHPDVRACVARALRETYRPEDDTLLRSLLLDSNAQVRGHALDCLLEHGRELTDAEIIAFARDESWTDNSDHALNSRERISDSGTMGVLAALIGDPELALWNRMAAARLLRRSGYDRVPENLTAQLRSETNRVRGNAARVLGALGLSSCRESLERLLEDPDEEVRVDAVRAIVEMGDSRSADVLAPLVNHREWEIRSLAVEGLAKGKDRRGIQSALDELAHRKHDTNEHQLAKIVFRYGDSETRVALIRRIRTPEPGFFPGVDICHGLEQAQVRLTHEEQRLLLDSLHVQGELYDAPLKALVACGADLLPEFLEKRMSSLDPTDQVRALGAFHALKAEISKGSLLPLLNSPSPEVRVAAVLCVPLLPAPIDPRILEEVLMDEVLAVWTEDSYFGSRAYPSIGILVLEAAVRSLETATRKTLPAANCFEAAEKWLEELRRD